MRSMIVNFTVFQVVFFACVLGGAWGWPWIGPLLAVVAVSVHWTLSPRPETEMQLLAAAGAIGLLWDSALVSAGLLEYHSGIIVEGLAPVWIVALWVTFATTFNVTMRWMKGRLVLASALGAVFGPFSFYGGSRMGAVSFPDPVAAFVVLALGWAVLMPALVWLGERRDGWGEPVTGDVPGAAS